MHKRAILGILAALFFGPVIVAWLWFFYFAEGAVTDTVNKGQLIDPVIPLADVELVPRGESGPVQPFTGDWSIVILAPQACDAVCESGLYTTRQVWRRLNKDMDRVQRVLIAAPEVEVDREQHPVLRIFNPTQQSQRHFIEAVPSHEPSRRVFLVDPFGNLMMSYPLDLEPEMLHDDLKRLLRYSQAG